MPNITTCSNCTQLYEAGSEEQANEPDRLCRKCLAECVAWKMPTSVSSMSAPPASLSDEYLASICVKVHEAEDLPGTWVASFTSNDYVTQGSSRVDAVVMLLDAARLVLEHQAALLVDMGAEIERLRTALFASENRVVLWREYANLLWEHRFRNLATNAERMIARARLVEMGEVKP